MTTALEIVTVLEIVTALDIVTLERVKSELRIPATITDHDLIIEGQIRSAVSWVSQQTGLPLVDTVKKFYSVPRGEHEPILLDTNFAKSIDRIDYWDMTGSLNTQANASLSGASLSTTITGIASVFPPDTGWPTILDGSEFLISLTIGYDITVTSQALESAVISLVRDLYTGVSDYHNNSIVDAMITPFIVIS